MRDPGPTSPTDVQASRMPVHERLHEDRASVWMLTTGPCVWLVHFLVCYITGALWCAKAATRAASLDEVRIVLGAATLVALLLVSWFGWRAWRQHRFGATALPHDAPTADDRHRFLGFATALLCGLSFVAVLYSAVVLLVVETCR